MRRDTSLSPATSKNSVNASTRLARASSIDWPWLATSSSGQVATKPSSSLSMIAVNRNRCIVPIYRMADRLGTVKRTRFVLRQLRDFRGNSFAGDGLRLDGCLCTLFDPNLARFDVETSWKLDILHQTGFDLFKARNVVVARSEVDNKKTAVLISDNGVNPAAAQSELGRLRPDSHSHTRSRFAVRVL